MASEKEANLARERHAELLRSMGAHAVTVDKVRRQGKSTFAVVALFSEAKTDIPETLKVKVGSKMTKVPLLARVADRFRPE